METKLLLKALSKRFPKRYAKMNHDRVGLMWGKLPNTINKILLCLDFDHLVLPEAISFKPDLIITHHPFIFGPRVKVLSNDEVKKNLCDELTKEGFVVYSYHTNFDTGRGGMNDALTKALELENIYAPEKVIMMRIGTLKSPMPVEEFARYANEKLNVSYSLLINKGKELVSKVGIVGGGGSRHWKVAKDEGCDIYVSGDVPHHTRRDIILNNYNYLDMPHEIEKIFMNTMKNILLELDPSLEIKVVDHEELPKVI